jgi:hypothetical protein
MVSGLDEDDMHQWELYVTLAKELACRGEEGCVYYNGSYVRLLYEERGHLFGLEGVVVGHLIYS